jgi:hypothetical protein
MAMKITSNIIGAAACLITILALTSCDQFADFRDSLTGKSDEQKALEQQAVDALHGKGINKYIIGAGNRMFIEGVSIIPVGNQPCETRGAVDLKADRKCVVFDRLHKTVNVTYTKADGSSITEDWSVFWSSDGLDVRRPNGQAVTMW